MKSWIIIFVLIALVLGVTSAESGAASKPNIIYLMLDDAGYGDFSCYGQKYFKTPNIDRIALEGMRFTDHYSGATVCAPTRCSLMTGLHTGHCFVRGNKEVKPEGQSPMPANIVTIPRLLKKAGYVTGAFGKWGLGAPSSPSDPSEHFDLFYGYNCQREAHTYYPKHLWRNKSKIELDGKTYAHDVIHAESLDFIRNNKDRPFFLFLPVTIPHAAMHAPEEEMKPWRKQFPQFENVIGKYSGPNVRNPVAAFAAMMTRLDRGVGEISALLKELKIDDNTIMFITSDNGPHLEGGHKPKFFDSNGPYKGFKRDLYEGGIRTPLIVRWPGKVKAKTTSDHISAHWDMLPTMCELAGTKPPPGLDGISMVNEITGKSQKAHDYLYWEHAAGGGKQAVRMGEWKGVRLGLRKNRNAPVEVYNLNNDPGETKNVAKANQKIAAKLLSIMQEAHVKSDTFKLLAGE